MSNMTVGGRKLARILDRHGTSEREAAELLGCSRSALNRYLHEERPWPGAVLVRIQTVYGIAPAEFFREERKR